MKKFLHAITTAMVHALWIIPLWGLSMVGTIFVLTLANYTNEDILRVMSLEGVFAFGLWVLLIVHEMTKE